MVLSIFLWIISWWNVENFFDTRHDSLYNDLEYTPEGARYWTYTRYKNKVDHIARVICNMGGGSHPLIVGLGEVENDYCLRSLCYAMPHFPYRPIHYDSPDERGVDVAALYDTTLFTLSYSRPLSVDLGEDRTRDILFFYGVTPLLPDTLYGFFCHLPSMRGGAASSEWKRKVAKQVIQHKVDSLFTHHPDAYIFIMGDMNCAPKNDLLGLENYMIPLAKKGDGTHYYNGRWACLDQCYLSPALALLTHVAIYRPSWLLIPSKDGLDSIPHRTYHGYHYDKNGYSDHLPVYLYDHHFPH